MKRSTDDINAASSSYSEGLTSPAARLHTSVVGQNPKQTFMQAIHVHKQNGNYDQMFQSLEELCKKVVSKPADKVTDWDMIVLRSFDHHCSNPRYGWSDRPEARNSNLRQRVESLIPH